jgi:hypothetical protein
MNFLAPIFLAGFIALAVPIIIHLWSKNTKTSMAFGSVRFLEETETRTMRSIMPSQWLLLLLRILLVTVLVLLLSGLVWNQNPEKVRKLYLIDREYSDNPVVAALYDTLPASDKMLWLASSFPDFSEPTPHDSTSYWSLLSNAKLTHAENVVVISPLLVKDFWGKKRAFPVEYQWIQLPNDSKEKLGLTFTQKGEKWQLKTIASEEYTNHEWLSVEKAQPLEVSYSIVETDKFSQYAGFTRAAITTLNQLSPLQLIETSSDKADWLFWYSEEVAPNRSQMIIINESQIQPWLALTKDRITISSDWNDSQAIMQQFPKKLLQTIADNIETEIENNLSMNTAVFAYEKLDAEPTKENNTAVSEWLWLVLLLILVAERFVSFKSAAL